MLEVRNLGVTIAAPQGRLKAVRDVSFTVRAGETLALVGESGCGKSMTALALMRLLPPAARVSSGSVILDGEDLLGLPESAMRSRRGGSIAMIFQEPATSLNPVMRIGDQIAESVLLHSSASRAEAAAAAVRWLERVGIERPEERARAFPFQLSGGQKQRVMIACALAAKPKVLVADEATTALDVTLQAQVLDLLHRLQAEEEVALLLITHDLALVQKHAGRVALMYAGEIVEEAECREFFARPLHPYARMLLKAVPSAGKRSSPLAGIPGTVPPLWEKISGCRFAGRCPGRTDACCSRPVPLAEAGPGRLVRCPGFAGFAAEDAAGRPRTGEFGEEVFAVRDFCVDYEQRRGMFRRPGRFRAVDGVTLSVRAGETLALVGESGSGKTTLARAAMRLMDSSVKVSGEARIGGADILRAGGGELKRLRGYAQLVFQDPFASLDPRMTVGECLMEGMRELLPASEAEMRRRTAGLLERVGLAPDAAGRLPHEFSGGQRQRIAIARALAVRPKLLVCDEPTSALDVSVQAQILNLMRSIQEEYRIGCLFITHNFAVVEYVADTVAVMRRGRLVEMGRAADVLGSPRDPYTRKLLQAVPRLQ